MTKEYYIIVSGQQQGPMTKENLPAAGLTADSLVWTAGMSDWTRASDVTELADLIVEESAFGGYAVPENRPETVYFAILNGRQTGPMNIQALIAAGLTLQTPVWNNNMGEWAPASTRPDIVEAFGKSSNDTMSTGNQTMPPSYPGFTQTPGYAPGMTSGPYIPQPTKPHTNWMGWAIAATILSFLFSCIGCVFGIIGIVQANRANELYARHENNSADSANSMARAMTIIALVLTVLGIAATIFLFSTSHFTSYVEMLR